MLGEAKRARSQGGADRSLGPGGVMGMVAQQIQYRQNLKGKCNGGVQGLEGTSEGGTKRPASLGRGSGRGRQSGCIIHKNEVFKLGKTSGNEVLELGRTSGETVLELNRTSGDEGFVLGGISGGRLSSSSNSSLFPFGSKVEVGTQT